MLYKKNQAESLSKELFENPTSEYRCTPFWAWNTAEYSGIPMNSVLGMEYQAGTGSPEP